MTEQEVLDCAELRGSAAKYAARLAAKHTEAVAPMVNAAASMAAKHAKALAPTMSVAARTQLDPEAVAVMTAWNERFRAGLTSPETKRRRADEARKRSLVQAPTRRRMAIHSPRRSCSGGRRRPGAQRRRSTAASSSRSNPRQSGDDPPGEHARSSTDHHVELIRHRIEVAI
jgi:hypothetical protein